MKIQSTRNITDILQNSSLAKIVRHSNKINELNHKIQYLLPIQYKNLYRLVDFSESCFTIEVKNATVRQGLLLQQPFLLKLIQTDFPAITQLEFRVNPNFK